MAAYYLKDINDYQWKRFKASCDIQGITMRDFFLSAINHAVADLQANPEYIQGFTTKQKKGGKKK